MSFIKTKIPKGAILYTPRFPEKYKGDYPIICRSSYEETFCKWCDINPSILRWSSETLEILYYDPVTLKQRRYYPDFAINIKSNDDRDKIFIVEIKPYKETIPPSRSGRKSNKTKINESRTWATNLAKWTAADSFCRKRGYQFKIITEKELYENR
jgi:hypothetical protein